MAAFPKGALIVGQPRMRDGQCVMSLEIDKRSKEWRKWAWGVVRREVAKNRIPFWRWPQVACLVGRFMWRVSR
ncbi:hypothetical protein LCGC14_0500120 [marine sediment metagenome]|uniref:Uncharacterized protein n=1 Tax=marine sediment metagenome TaxID=412755 RepID=A0A0F9S938_9ZZZZ